MRAEIARQADLTLLAQRLLLFVASELSGFKPPPLPWLPGGFRSRRCSLSPNQSAPASVRDYLSFASHKPGAIAPKLKRALTATQICRII
jgi:hypothetical protein